MLRRWLLEDIKKTPKEQSDLILKFMNDSPAFLDGNQNKKLKRQQGEQEVSLLSEIRSAYVDFPEVIYTLKAGKSIVQKYSIDGYVIK